MPCHGIKGAYQHPEVRIGWAPYIALQETEVRTKPGDGMLLVTLAKGKTMGRQSARNPSGSPTPPLREPVEFNGNEYIWVCTRTGSFTGWVRLDHVGPDPNSINRAPFLGPAGLDFEIGRARDDGWVGPLVKKPSGCGHISLTKPLRKVSVRDTYLRYSERGTAFHHLHKGDVVQLILVDAPHGFAFCEVKEVTPGSAAKVGSRGFVMQTSLAPIDS